MKSYFLLDHMQMWLYQNIQLMSHTIQDAVPCRAAFLLYIANDYIHGG
jgi:hypothetical protein